MSSLYFHKSRALYHMSVLLRYGACSLHHQCERMQFTIYFKKKNKNTCSSSIVDLSTWEFLGTLEKCEKHLPLACASPLFPLVFKNSRVLVKLNNVLSMFVTSLIICFTLSAYLLIPMLTTSIDNRSYPLDAIK